jgi:hypothetical protein
LTLLLTGLWISPFATSETDFWQIPEFSVLRSSWLCRFEIPDFRMFITPRLCRFKIPENRMSATPRLRRSKIPENRMFATPRLHRSKIPKNRMCLAPEKHISRTSLNSTFRGWRVFLNSAIVVSQAWKTRATNRTRNKDDDKRKQPKTTCDFIH